MKGCHCCWPSLFFGLFGGPCSHLCWLSGGKSHETVCRSSKRISMTQPRINMTMLLKEVSPVETHLLYPCSGSVMMETDLPSLKKQNTAVFAQFILIKKFGDGCDKIRPQNNTNTTFSRRRLPKQTIDYHAIQV